MSLTDARIVLVRSVRTVTSTEVGSVLWSCGKRALIRADDARQGVRNGAINVVRPIDDSSLDWCTLGRRGYLLRESLHCRTGVERHALRAEIWPRGALCAASDVLASDSALSDRPSADRGSGEPVTQSMRALPVFPRP